MTPPVSVVATVKDEADTIEPFLRSLLAQSRPPEEIVVVDGGSTDGTAEALERAASSEPRLRVHRAPGSSIAAGRNAGIRHAAGPIIAVTDAGTVVAPNWLESLMRPFESNGRVDVAAGFFVPGGEQRFERYLSVVITPQLPEIDPETFLPSSRSVAFRKQAWERVGGYPEWIRHCEDLVFDLSLKDAGASFEFVPDALVSWRARSSLRQFARQYFNYARGDGHANLWPRRHAIRFGSYAAGATLAAAGRRRPIVAALLPLLAGAYLSKFYRRLWRLPPSERRGELALAVLAVPVFVVIGDLAKMVGYPVGLYERHRAGGREQIEQHRVRWLG